MNSTTTQETPTVKAGTSRSRPVISRVLVVNLVNDLIALLVGKKTIFVTGFSDDVNEQELLQAFVTFGEYPSSAILSLWCSLAETPINCTAGDIIEISVPVDPRDREPGRLIRVLKLSSNPRPVESKHRGFAFITFSSAMDAQDAIDNYDFNELPGRQGRGKYLKVNIAKPDNKAAGAAGMRGDRAGTLIIDGPIAEPLEAEHDLHLRLVLFSTFSIPGLLSRPGWFRFSSITSSVGVGRMAGRKRKAAGSIERPRHASTASPRSPKSRTIEQRWRRSRGCRYGVKWNLWDL